VSDALPFANDERSGLTQPEVDCKLQNIYRVCLKIGVRGRMYENLTKRALAYLKGFSWDKVAGEFMKILRAAKWFM
jgi:hypothetical protein